MDEGGSCQVHVGLSFRHQEVHAADDMQVSQGEFFPIDTTGEVNEEEASEYYKLL